MIIYKVYLEDSMCFEHSVECHLNKNKAWIAYNKLIEEIQEFTLNLLSNSECRRRFGRDNFDKEYAPYPPILERRIVFLWEDDVRSHIITNKIILEEIEVKE